MTEFSALTEVAPMPSFDGTAIISSVWDQFNRLFPTEADCMVKLSAMLNEEDVQRCDCGHTRVERVHSGRIIRCGYCYKKKWLTAGTFFHHIRRARPWLAAIFLMENGVAISASTFHKLVGVAYSTAWTIFKKITVVIQSQMTEEAQGIPSSLFGSIFCRRSRETPARRGAFSEQEAIETSVMADKPGKLAQANEPASLPLAAVTVELSSSANCYAAAKLASHTGKDAEAENQAVKLCQAEQQVYDILSEEPVQFDLLCQCTGIQAGKLSSVLTMLELAELAQRMPGDRYVRCTPGKNKKRGDKFIGPGNSLPESTKIAVDRIIHFVQTSFQGISRKYLQNYLARYWCHVDRNRWQLSTLLKLCLRFRHVSYKEILDFVSPPLVKMCY